MVVLRVYMPRVFKRSRAIIKKAEIVKGYLQQKKVNLIQLMDEIYRNQINDKQLIT